MNVTKNGRPMIRAMKHFGSSSMDARRTFLTSQLVSRSIRKDNEVPPVGIKDGLVQGLDLMTGESIAAVGSADIDVCLKVILNYAVGITY